MKILLYTILALVAFAGNSILCRMALGGNAIDPASFTLVRLLAGAVVLAVILKLKTNSRGVRSRGSWRAALMLFVYALAFSYAYLSLNTAAGALVLFGSVQIVMILVSLLKGGKLHWFEVIGVVIAFSGLVYLVFPGVSAPSLGGFLLMTLAGIAWALYTIAGKGSADPLSDTAYNFIRTLPLLILLGGVAIMQCDITLGGICLALLSGGVTSGIGYSIWYSVVKKISVVQAAVVQLFVPIIAAVGGVIFVNESLSYRIILSSIFTLSGILVVMISRQQQVTSDLDVGE